MDVKGTLGRKIGPLPAIAWVGMMAAVYVIYRYRKAASAAAGASDVPVVSPTGDIGSAADFSSGFGGGGSTATGALTTNGSVSPIDNTQWEHEALNAAIAYGYDPLQANNALSQYLYGGANADTLNSQQSAILRWVLSKFSTPPQPVTSVLPTTPIPTATQNPAPVAPAAPSQEEISYGQWQAGRGALGQSLNPFAGWGPWSSLSAEQQAHAATFLHGNDPTVGTWAPQYGH